MYWLVKNEDLISTVKECPYQVINNEVSEEFRTKEKRETVYMQYVISCIPRFSQLFIYTLSFQLTTYLTNKLN